MRPTQLQLTVRLALAKAGLCLSGRTLVAALSGGADSVAQLDVLVGLSQELGFSVVAAHLDHRLRADSQADAAFCAELCRELGVPLEIGAVDVRAAAPRLEGGLEQAAREARYAFLREVQARTTAAAIAVAHTRDDQAETFLLRLLRGSGRAGLSAMRLRQGPLIRPLLAASRAEVLAHLAQRGLSWREDPTNADLSLARNRVRHELIPYLEAQFNPRLRETLMRSAELITDEKEALDALAAGLALQAVRLEKGQLVVSRPALQAAPRAVARLVLRQALAQIGGLRGVGALQLERLLDLTLRPEASGRRLPLSGGREAHVCFAELRLGPRQVPPRPFALALPVPGSVRLPDGLTLTAAPTAGPAACAPWSAVLALSGAEPLTVRTRQPGDRLRLHGRERSLKRFLMERHVPAEERASLPLVASGQRILWIPGQPMDGGGAGSRFVRVEAVQA